MCLAQLIGTLQRRADERRRRRTEIAGVVAETLSLIASATHHIKQADIAQTTWYQQLAWQELREQAWPPLRTFLYVQAAQEPSFSGASFEGVALRIQALLTSYDDDAGAALAAWEDARREILLLRDRR